MARTACEQWEEFNKTGTIPKPIKDVGRTKLCGWFSKGIAGGDVCGDIRHFWLGCEIGNATSRIQGGIMARKNAYPSDILFDGYLCGGSILNEEWVLTAAHCVYFDGEWVMYAGMHLSSDNPTVQKLVATKVVRHPQYDPKVVLNGIAVVKFGPKLKFSDAVQPVQLPKETDFRTKGIGISIGWGVNESLIATLRQVELPLITTEKCRELFEALEPKEDNVTITDNYVCGYYPTGSVRTACHGDSGSPFYVCEDSKLVQIGVTDLGGDCKHNDPVGLREGFQVCSLDQGNHG